MLRWCKGQRRGRIAGYVKPDGYRQIEISLGNGRSIYPYAARVAWAIATGAWPIDQLDHRDGNRDNNRLANLRQATRAENMQNLVPRPRKNAPLVGVSKAARGKNSWRAQMSGHYIGTFYSPEEAHQAYLAAKAERHAFQPRLRGG